MCKPARPRGLALIVLVVVSVAVGWTAVPFKDGRYRCDPAIWTAWHAREVAPALPRGEIGVPASIWPPYLVRCKTPARRRVSNSADVIALAVVAYIVVRRRDRARAPELVRSGSR